MKSRRFFQWSVMFGCAALMACGSGAKKETEKPLVGGDRDSHGCIGSAGYQWSEVLKDCIRPFEVGKKMRALQGDDTLGAYIVFGADSAQVELFLPGQKEHAILNRKVLSDRKAVWTDAQGDVLTVKCVENSWGIYEYGQQKYVE